MKENEFVEFRSEEVQELLTRTSPWLLRYGVIVISIMLFILFVAAFLVRFPDLIRAPFKLHSSSAPKELVSRSEGKVARLFVLDGQTVKAAEILAFIESTADHDEILRLEKEIERTQRLAIAGHFDSVNYIDLNSYQRLGELQTTFQAFVQSHMQLKNFTLNGYYVQTRKLLEAEVGDLRRMERSLLQQQELHEKDMMLADGEYEVQKLLADSSVIAPLDLKREEGKRISRKLPFQQVNASLISNSLSRKAKQQEILELDRRVAEGKDTFLQSINTLHSEVAAWKLRHIVVAPVSGVVYFSKTIEENQNVAINETLCYIAPAMADYYGELQIPQRNLGKIKVGQDVLIKFEGYPFEEFGAVRGKIQTIANVSTRDNSFRARVIFPEGLITNYKKKLSYRTGMTATAEIITADQRIAEKLFYQLRKVMGPIH